MKSSIKMILMALSLLVLGAIIVYQNSMLEATKHTIQAQKETLYELQGEFKEQDLNLLDGEIVSASEASSLVRKYRNKCTISKNGVVLNPEVAASRTTFAENTNWVVTVEVNANGVCTGIGFVSPLGIAKEPKNVEEAKSSLAGAVGGHASDGWNSLMARIENLTESEKYRETIAPLLSLANTCTWSDILHKVEEITGGGDGSTSAAKCERVSLQGGESKNFTIGSPQFCYYYSNDGSGSGIAVIENGVVTDYGGSEVTGIDIDLTSKTITNEAGGEIHCVLVDTQV